MESVHIVGIGGVGMSALAYVCHRLGIKVSGSDLKQSAPFERLKALGLDVSIGHSKENVPSDVDCLVYTSAIKSQNDEIDFAKANGIKVVPREELLKFVSSKYKTIAVAGSHGKTTTSSMLASMLLKNDLSISYLIGGDINEVGSNSGLGTSPWLVVESDESDKSFLILDCVGSIITNLEADHLESYGSFENLIDSFIEFINNTKEICVLCGDDENLSKIISSNKITSSYITYGQNESFDFQLVEYSDNNLGSISQIRNNKTGQETTLKLLVPGRHNALNALACIALSVELLGIDFVLASESISSFAGVARRFQIRYQQNDITIIDDYAHLPTEIVVTIKSAIAEKSKLWDKVVAVFQPHKYSRTKMLAKDFGKSFDEADEIIITDIYSAGEDPIPGVSGESIVHEIKLHNPNSDVKYIEHKDDLIHYLRNSILPKTCLLTIGAGDITTLADEIF